MTAAWQIDETARLVATLPPGSTVVPYGSTVTGDLDGWSDLDVDVALTVDALDLGRVFDPMPWTWQLVDHDRFQVGRVVLCDGRRIDLRVSTGRIVAADEPADRAVRFDCALAAVHLGRSDRLIGLHLALGVVREALVTAMLLRDRDTGVAHHIRGAARDRAATDALAAVSDTLGPSTVERVAELYGTWRAELDPEYVPDWSGLRAVIERGRTP